MSPNDFVDPEIVRLPLSGGAYVDVKKELTAGETRRVFGRMVKGVAHFGEKLPIDPEQVGLAKMLEYLIGWSFTNKAGHPVPVSESAINNLRQDRYREISEAIDAHERAMEAEKNLPGETPSVVISPLHD